MKPTPVRPIAALSLALALTTAPVARALDTSLVRETGAQTPEQEQAGFTVPAGFEVQLFAAEPQIDKPVNIAFDDRGRLWVTSTHEYPYAAPRERWADPEGSRVRDSRDAIVILEDTDRDGRADRRTVFADGLNIPTGVLPYGRGCIAWSIPNLWYFEDTDGDGVCDRRQILFGPLGWEKDVHGNCSSLRLAPDGWVYATHGFSNESHFQVRPENLQGAQPGDPGTALTLQSGNVFRFRPDGSRVELFTGGQVNPFGLAWDRQGNLYSADCHSAPIYQLLPGAVYPSFGKPDDGLGYGPVMMHHTHSSTGICGIVYLDRADWGEAWQDRILIGNVVTSRINCDRAGFHGSTPVATEQPDFLESADPWFRPVDLRLGPDRALYVADFYNKVIGHYEVPLEHPGRDRERGRIWRIVKKDGLPEGEGRATAPADERAVLRFAARAGALTEVQRARVAQWLQAGSPTEQRVAAEACLQLAGPEWLPALLAAFPRVAAEDEALRHQLRLAVREQLRRPGGFARLGERRGTEGGLGQELVAIARSLKSEPAARWLFERLRAEPPGTPGELAASLQALAVSLPPAELMALARERFAADWGTQADLLAAIVEGVEQRGELPGAPLLGWGNEIAAQLLEPPAVEAWQVVADPRSAAAPWTVQRRGSQEGGEVAVISSLDGAGAEPERRMGTLRSAAFVAPADFSFLLCGHAGPPGEAPHERNFIRLVEDGSGVEIVRALPPRNDVAQRVRWDLQAVAGRRVRLELTDGDAGEAYAWLAAGDFQPPVMAVADFQAGREQRLGRLARLLRYAAPAGLRDRLAGYLPAAPPPPPSPVTPEMQAALDEGIAARVAGYAKARPDRAKGAGVFTANCAACHAIGGQGALVGPQLDGIGHRGAARLIEDILDPNRNVDAHFRLHLISRKDGSTFAGLERGRAGQVLVGVDAAGAEQRIPLGDIVKNEETGLSLMPPAFAQTIPEADFYDLLAWLLEVK